MPKFKHKVSGGFLSKTGVAAFAIIRSYLSTLHKQSASLFSSFVLAFQGSSSPPRCRGLDR